MKRLAMVCFVRFLSSLLSTIETCPILVDLFTMLGRVTAFNSTMLMHLTDVISQLHSLNPCVFSASFWYDNVEAREHQVIPLTWKYLAVSVRVIRHCDNHVYVYKPCSCGLSLFSILFISDFPWQNSQSLMRISLINFRWLE